MTFSLMSNCSATTQSYLNLVHFPLNTIFVETCMQGATKFWPKKSGLILECVGHPLVIVADL